MKESNTAQPGTGGPTYMNHLVLSFVLLFAGVAITIVQYKVPPILEPLMTQFDMNVSSASWLISIFTAMGIFLSLPTSSLSQRIGPKRVLLLSCGIIVAGSLIGALATSSWLLIASRAIEGVAFVFITVAAPLAIERYVEPSKQGSANGIWALWICFGSVIGSSITPLVFEALGYTGTWLIYAGIVVVAAVALTLLVRVPKTAEATGELPSPDAEAEDAAADGGIHAYLRLLRPNALVFYFAYLVFNIEILAVLSYTPTFLQSQGMNASLSGFAASLPGLLAAISSPLFGKLIDKTGKAKPFYIVAMAASGPATLLMMTQSGPLLWVGAALMGLVGYAVPVCCLSSLPQIAGSRSALASAMGLLMLVQGLGEFLGSLITPMLLGPTMSEWLLAGSVICILGILATVGIALCRFK